MRGGVTVFRRGHVGGGVSLCQVLKSHHLGREGGREGREVGEKGDSVSISLWEFIWEI